MPTKNISVGEAYKFGWTSFKANIGYFVKIFAVIIAVYVALSFAAFYTSRDQSSPPDAILGIVNSAFEIVIAIGLIKIAITFVRGVKPQVADLFSSYRLFLKFLFGSMLNGLIVSIGVLLFIIPGVVWSLKFSQQRYLIVDKGQGPIESLKGSSKLTSGAKWDLLGFLIIAFAVNVLGFLSLVIGLLVTAPITMLAYAHVYQQLLDQEKTEVAVTSAP